MLCCKNTPLPNGNVPQQRLGWVCTSYVCCAGGSIAAEPAFLRSAVRTEAHRCQTACHRACSCRCWECGEVDVEKQSNHHPPIQYSSSLPPVFREKSQSKRVRCCNHHTPAARLLFAARMGCMLHVGFVAALESRFATRSSAIDPSRPKRDIDSSSRARRWTGAKKGKREARATHVSCFFNARGRPTTVGSCKWQNATLLRQTRVDAQNASTAAHSLVMKYTCSWITSPWTQLPRRTRSPSRRRQAPRTRRQPSSSGSFFSARTALFLLPSTSAQSFCQPPTRHLRALMI